MLFLTNLGAQLFYMAATILTGGLIFKILQYGRTLALLKMPTISAPVARGEVAIRLLKEVTVFTRLFKSKQMDRACSMPLRRVWLHHLRYFTEPARTPPLKAMRVGPRMWRYIRVVTHP
jgi:nitrate reductase gamma subunit